MARTDSLRAGQTLTVTAATAGDVIRMADEPNHVEGDSLSTTSLAASEVRSFGPFAGPTWWSMPGDASYSMAAAALDANSVGVGTAATVSNTVTVAETGDGAFHRTVLTLTAMPITLTDDAGVGQWGTVKLYDFPAGNIITIGATIAASITLTEAAWADTAEGDIALGSAASTDASALTGTLATWLASTAIPALTAQVGTCNASDVTVNAVAAAGTTDNDLILNVLIDDDAAHATGGGTITGTVTVVWANSGDY